jgi:DNA-directed RNA polymerase specialized sigma24 family protein
MATNPALTRQASRGHDDPVVTGLVTRARNGDRQTWDALVDRYAALIWPICRSHRLEAADAQNAAQNVWLPLMDHLDSLRDPAALPGWLATTTRHECGRIARGAATLRRRACAGRRDHSRPSRPGGRAGPARSRPARGLREAFGQLPLGYQQLLALHIEAPALSHAEISARLGIPAITALINAGTQTATPDAWPQ